MLEPQQGKANVCEDSLLVSCYYIPVKQTFSSVEETTSLVGVGSHSLFLSQVYEALWVLFLAVYSALHKSEEAVTRNVYLNKA